MRALLAARQPALCLTHQPQPSLAMNRTMAVFPAAMVSVMKPSKFDGVNTVVPSTRADPAPRAEPTAHARSAARIKVAIGSLGPDPGRETRLLDPRVWKGKAISGERPPGVHNVI